MIRHRNLLARPTLLAGTLALSVLDLHCGADSPGSAFDGGASTGESTGGNTSAGGSATASGGGNASGGANAAGNTSSGGSATAGGGGKANSGGDTGGASNAGGYPNSGGANTGGKSSAGGASGAGGKANAGGSSSGGANAGGSTGTAGAPNLPGWNLVWSDEFNDGKGTAVDSSKWNLVNKGDGFGNNELEFYTNRTDNAAMDGNGFLVITAKKEAYLGRDYTSARLESNGKFERAYGRVEARIKIPRGQGIWPAFWMLGNNIGSVSWPTCGEIDIMENIGKEPSIVHGSLHGPGYSGGNPLGAAYTLPNGEKFADAFHVFAIEWETNVIRFYVDDHLYETRTSADVPANAKWVYDHPFYILLNVAVGGQWPGSPDGTTTFPQTMTVDYVRVYGK
jgi:beta-glucanase (GH16 family)